MQQGIGAMLNQVLAQQEPQVSSFLGFVLPLALVFVIFYLIIYRPMKTRQRNHRNLIDGLKNGDKVVTTGGIYGTVAGLRDHSFFLKVSDQVKLEVSKSAVASLRVKPEPDSPK